MSGGAPDASRPWSAFLAMSVAIAAAVSGEAAGAPPPPGAVEVIARVNRSAGRSDFAALRADMVQDFRWSFGGDANAEQAIDEWKKQPRQMRQLAKVTRAKCAYRKDGYVECPANAGESYRAGFKLRDGHWKLEYFVGGD